MEDKKDTPFEVFATIGTLLVIITFFSGGNQAMCCITTAFSFVTLLSAVYYRKGYRIAVWTFIAVMWVFISIYGPGFIGKWLHGS